MPRYESWWDRWPDKLMPHFQWICVGLIATGAYLVGLDTEVPGLGNLVTFETAHNSIKTHLAECWGECDRLLRNTRCSLWIDSLLFVPLYVVFLICLQRNFVKALEADETKPRVLDWAVPVNRLAAVPILAGTLDLIENGTTLYALIEAGQGAATTSDWLLAAIMISAWMKWILVTIAMGISAWLFSLWFFKSSDGVANDRAQLRRAVVDIVWRTKFALLVVVVYGLVILVMKQPHDAIARQLLDCTPEDKCQFGVYDHIGLLMTLLAISALSTVEWYWPRIILRLKSPGSEQICSTAVETFARWWARMLGLCPLLLSLIFVLGIPHPDSADGGSRHIFLVLGVIALILLFLFLTAARPRQDREQCYYYNCVSCMNDVRSDLRSLSKLSAWAPPIIFVVSRVLSELPGSPPLVFAVLCSGLATWAGILGWLAYESRVRTAPFVLLAVALVTLFGIFNGSEIHQVLPPGAFDPAAERNLQLGRLAVSILVGTVLLAGCLIFFKARTGELGIRHAGTWATVGVWILILVIALLFDSNIPTRLPATNEAHLESRFIDGRPNLESALEDWLKGIHGEICRDSSNSCSRQGPRQPVYFVSAEGGGIRAAYWAALVLSRLHKEAGGANRVFSISGVSGGSIGATTYVACSRQAPDNLQDCVNRLGQADLLTQTFGAALFEDALASVIPTSWLCKHPGCGIFGRSYWFEGKLESAVPELGRLTILHPTLQRNGAVGSVPTNGPTPHLFLNATRVESGQRAIAATVQIDGNIFPGAVDQIRLLQHDIRFSTAGHVSARFPFVNPVAAAFGTGCPEDRPLANSASAGERSLCQHWVDGGYLDVSGAHTTLDIVRLLRECLRGTRCGSINDEMRGDLRGRISPVVLAISNGISSTHSCFGRGNGRCFAPHSAGQVLDEPPHRAPLRLLTNQLAPVATLVAVATSSSSLAEARLEREVNSLWEELKIKRPAEKADWKAFQRISQVNDGKAIYPLGWMLSRRAQRQMSQQAEQIPRSALLGPAQQ